MGYGAKHGLTELQTEHSLLFIFGSDDIDLKVEQDILDPRVVFTRQTTYSNPPAIQSPGKRRANSNTPASSQEPISTCIPNL